MRPRRLPELLAVGLVLTVAVVAAVVTVSAERASSRVARWETVAGTIQADIAVGHVWLEERLTGDLSNTLQIIYGNFDAARARCRALRDGGPSPDGGSVEAVDDGVLHAEIVDECRQLDVLRSLTALRLRLHALPGSEADQRYDAQFRSTLALAESLPRGMRALGDRQERRLRETETGAILVLGTALLVAAAVIRRRQRQLERVAREREIVLEAAGEGILAIDPDGTISFANSAAAVLLGWTSSELTGLTADDLLVERPRGEHDGGTPAWRQPAAVARTAELRRRDGSSFPIEYTATSGQQRAERATVVVTFRDITTRRRREVEREAELAELRAMRATLVPAELPDRGDLALANCFVPATSGVAGDFYLVTDEPGDATVLVVGDVAGKGVDAARCAAFVRTALATFAPYTQSPSRLLGLANRSLLEHGHDLEMLVTAACVVVRPSAHTITWALAGHAPPVSLDDGTPLHVRPGLPLGLEQEIGAEDAIAPLPPGAGFVVFTDGLYEARAPRATDDPGTAHFGLSRIGEVVAGLPGADPSDVVNALREAAEKFTEGTLTDDLCIVAARRGPGARALSKAPNARLAFAQALRQTGASPTRGGPPWRSRTSSRTSRRPSWPTASADASCPRSR